MKHSGRIRTAGILLAALAWTAQAQFLVETNNGTLTITGYTGTNTDVVIPAVIDSLKVTAIGDLAFYKLGVLTSVVIPDSVTTIGGSAFEECFNMSSATLGAGIEQIGNDAFNGCNALSAIFLGSNVTFIGESAFFSCFSLKDVHIPAGVTNIGYAAFRLCSSLTAISVDPANPVYGGTDGLLIDKGSGRLVQCPEGKKGTVVIPGDVTVIGIESFSRCAGVTRVNVHAGVTSIEDFSFYGCGGLTELYFEGAAPALGFEVFDGVTATVYYRPGADGWGTEYGGLPTQQLDPDSGSIEIVHAGFAAPGIFGFTAVASNDLAVVVEVCTNITAPAWQILATNAISGGSLSFSDPQAAQHRRRYYRVRTP